MSSSTGSALFALVIGIDSYKSGSIWNMHCCVDDAERTVHWLTEDLEVPKDHIKLLLDSAATKESIERTFMDHLVNNPAIQHGDAILVYFAGHGSYISAPKEWYRGVRKGRVVEVLCTYDYDTKDSQGLGRVAGISDRSMHAMLNDLAEAKGDNIALVLDTCFMPSQTPENLRERSRTRWTPSGKATGEDLYRGLWPNARAEPLNSIRFGFLEPCPTNYVIIAACSPGNIAVEGREGGHFTVGFLQAVASLSLHKTTYAQLSEHINRSVVEDGQKAICIGKHKNHLFFDDVPFEVDGRFLAVTMRTKREVRVEAGSVHGVTEGCELSLHSHHYRRSRNPSLATAVVVEAHPTWSLAQIKTQEVQLPKSCWGRISRWNNDPPFRVKLKASIASVMTIWKLKREFPTYALRTLRLSGVTAQGVDRASEADISIKVRRRSIEVERRDSNSSGTRTLDIKQTDAVKIINEAATFKLHLESTNPGKPLEKSIRVGLHDRDGHLTSKVGPNLLNPVGKTIIHPDNRNNMIFSMVIRNDSSLNLWPYVFAMDPDTFAMTVIYCPPSDNHSSDTVDSEKIQKKRRNPATPIPPLPSRGAIELPLSWPTDPSHRNPAYKDGFVKLLLCSCPIGSLAFLDNPHIPLARVIPNAVPSRTQWRNDSKSSNMDTSSVLSGRSDADHTWDTFIYPVVFANDSNLDLSTI